ncbi:MAG TPA: helix-turn-helix domain-containing protein [Bacillota bacterium]|nr:helix-turn-helix domain-containing protein [Bacillota bacterium]
MTIGERLKEAREAQNITLDDLQESTKIQKRYLTAIEQGDFDLLPGTFYARAFIKEYALAVGLDSTALLAEHSEEIPKTNGEMTEQYSRIQRSRRKSRSTSDSSAIFALIPRIIVILLIVGIIFIAWTLIQKTIGEDQPNQSDEQDSDEIIRPPKDPTDEPDDEDGASDDEATESDETDEEDETDESSDSITYDVVEVGSGDVPESTIAINYQVDELLLSLEADDLTWIAVTTEDGNAVTTVDGESLGSKEFADDESPLDIDITDQQAIYINAGNSPALTVRINDETIDFPVEDRVHQKLILQLNKE